MHEGVAWLAAHGPHLVLDVAVGVALVRGLARLFVPAAPLAAAAARARDAAGRPPPFDAGISCRALTPAIALDATDLDALKPGDVIVVSRATRTEGAYHGPARLVATTFELTGAFGPHGFAVDAAYTALSPEEAMDAPNPAPSPQVPNEFGPGRAPPLPVEIEIELARVRVSVTELCRVDTGAVLPLHVAPTDGVTLRLGDRVIGRGELVDVEGELGVRILSVLR